MSLVQQIEGLKLDSSKAQENKVQEMMEPDLTSRIHGGRVYTIILAEDSLVKRKMTTLYVTRAGINFNLYLPENGYDALMLAKSVDPHFIFMDIRMPNKEGITDGVVAAREIRRAGIAAPIVAVSADKISDTIQLDDVTFPLGEACKIVGMNEFHTTPLGVAKGIEILRRNLHLSDVPEVEK